MSDELEELVERGDGVNFIPCVKWVRRGAAKAVPEKVKLTQEELATVIEKTQKNIQEAEEAEEDEEQEDAQDTIEDESDDITKKYDLDNYDEEDDNPSNAADFGNLISHVNPRDDPYLVNPDMEDDQSDIEDYNIKTSDNLLLVGHVDGNAAVLEVYVYNDDEDALYVHHDVILPSYPMALEWLDFDPSEASKGNFVAVGSMSPIIDVWDVDVIDTLEPAFSLGQKGSKKKKISRIGHRDAVLSLAWNDKVGHLLASGSVDQTVLLWDLREGSVARTLKGHKEKVQALDWHPFESHVLLTGCCDENARVYDCNQGACKTWKVNGEVEKVLWNRFNPYNFLVATEKGYIHMVDARQDGKHLWTLSAHSEGINGMSMSSQCPGVLVTGSSDKTVKVWDIQTNDQPSCIMEKDLKIGMVHSAHNCPDAPFVFALGGDNPTHNMHVMDIRESAAVAERFSKTPLVDIYDKNESSVKQEEEPMNSEEATEAMEKLTVSSSGGAAGKFKKKEKKKKNKKKF